MIVRVYGKDRIMRIEMPEEALVASLIEEISSRVGSLCTSLLFRGKSLKEGTLREAGLEDGAIVNADYKVEKKPAETAGEEGASGGRGRVSSECTHGPSGMCDKCAPEDSWLSSSFENRRFVSQGAYEEFLATRDKQLEIGSHLPPQCRTHPASARCNKCLPKEITLTRQPFRPVDHVELHDKGMLEQLINEYREKPVQSVQLLIGRYSGYSAVAKGTKAEVFCLAPLEHKGLENGFVVNPADRILQGSDRGFCELLGLLGMTVVGMVYTRISEKRLPYVSSLEVEFIGRMQNSFPYMVDGVNKGSQFTTLVISGTSKSAEVVECSASHLAMELLRDGLLFASKNPAEMEVHPVSTVWTDNEGSHVGHTIPVEYLVVRPTHGVTAGKGIFETRAGRGQFKRGMGLSGLKKHFQKRIGESSVHGLSLGALADFQVLLELADREILSRELVETILAKDELRFMEDVLNGKYPALTEIAKECEELPQWACKICTLVNRPSSSACDACGIPKDG